MLKFLKILIVFILIAILTKNCDSIKDQHALNDMFEKRTGSYIGRPIKYLILESKFKLKYFSFNEASAPFYLNGLILTFNNDVKILVTIDEFRHEAKRNNGKLWDINKCILEKAATIELITDKPIVNKTREQNVSIEFVSMDSIIVRDDFYEKYLKMTK